MIVAPLRPGQIWQIELINQNRQPLMLGWSKKVLETGISFEYKNPKLLPGKIGCFMMNRRPEKEQYNQ
ncbi:MAG: hypothetical protein EZS28_009030, partial [Streblomastix strix]